MNTEADAYIETIRANDTFAHEFSITPNVQYRLGDSSAVMDVIAPMRLERLNSPDRKAPLVVFVQGSGWTTPNRMYAVGRLEHLVEQGYVVASVNHRDSLLGDQPFPGYLCDVKAAIRFLRAHAQQFYIDPQRVGVWGTSSGGNTALLLAMTGDDPRYADGSNMEFSDAVDYCVACFAPSDIYGVLNGERERTHEGLRACEAAAVGVHNTGDTAIQWDDFSEDQQQRAWDMSPYRIATSEQKYPPILLLHGDADDVVDYDESVQLYSKLRSQGHDCRLIRVAGGEHEGNFWSTALTDVICHYIAQQA
ncbi:prolyl oligopeptidase family serine peptidase [Alloscardovia omnicolens]|uniref:prolyl oligopeptidase family serine peptidase n=1 Tax=Alloscardovia omnicolens TaxID=419015 RepID=UPI003A66BB00